MIDKKTDEKILNFRDSRNWKQYHNGKDLAISISLEANELLEVFQWSADDLDRNDRLEHIKEELADILIYCEMFADYYHLDIDEIIDEKLKKNLIKYPEGKQINLKTKDINHVVNNTKSDEELLALYCLNNLDLTAPHYAEPYGSLGPCILDCIYSLQAKYFPVVIPLMERYGEKYMNGDLRLSGYTLIDFVNHINEAGGPELFASEVLKNRQVLCGRRKSAVCLEIANKLINAGIQTKEDFYNADRNEMERLLRSVKGVGDAATNYLFMLTGDSSRVKPDVHIHHCIRDAIGHDVTNDECQELFAAAVEILNEQYPKLTISALDGLVWSKYRVGAR